MHFGSKGNKKKNGKPQLICRLKKGQIVQVTGFIKYPKFNSNFVYWIHQMICILRGYLETQEYKYHLKTVNIIKHFTHK